MKKIRVAALGLGALLLVGMRFRPHPTVRPATASSPYVAFSLHEAEAVLRSGKTSQGMEQLCEITDIIAAVGDGNDLILVGKVEKGRPALELADLVVAMRAVLGKGEWPLVSIDRTPETARTGLQHVRLQAIPRQSGFAQKLLDGDAELKQIALGLVSSEAWGVKSYLALATDYAVHTGHLSDASSRFWFYPTRPALAVRENVCVLTNVDIGVITEVLSVNGKPVADTSMHDTVGDTFAATLSGRMAEFCVHSVQVARLKGLMEMVALSRGIQLMSHKPALGYWLKEYPLPQVKVRVPDTYPVKHNTADLTLGQGQMRLQVDGGCKLKALAVRLKEGDVTALHDIVLRSRPATHPLSWSVPLGAWRQTDAPESAGSADEGCLPDAEPGCPISRYLTPPGVTPKFQMSAPSSPVTFPPFSILDRLPRSSGKASTPPLPANPSLNTTLPHNRIMEGSSSKPVGGVLINPHPKQDGRGGSDIRDAVRQALHNNGATNVDVRPKGTQP